MPATQQKSEEMVQIVISNVPAELAEAIGELAKKNDRPRAAEIRKLLAEAVEQRRQAKAA